MAAKEINKAFSVLGDEELWCTWHPLDNIEELRTETSVPMPDALQALADSGVDCARAVCGDGRHHEARTAVEQALVAYINSIGTLHMAMQAQYGSFSGSGAEAYHLRSVLGMDDDSDIDDDARRAYSDYCKKSLPTTDAEFAACVRQRLEPDAICARFGGKLTVAGIVVYEYGGLWQKTDRFLQVSSEIPTL